MAVVLGTGVRGYTAVEAAKRLLEHCGGLVGLARASPFEMSAAVGVGPVRALRLAAAFHLGRRVMEGRRGQVVHGPDEVFERMRSSMAGLEHEVFVVLALDARNVIFDEIEVARGCLTGVDVHPREVFRPLIRRGAVAGIAVHNHPSGDPAPSQEDIELTGRLAKAGQLLGVPLVDHIVVGATAYVSLAEHLG